MSAGRELTCRELVELVTDYLEGSLSREDRKRFERHIAGCDGCSGYVEQMRVTIRAVGTLSEEALSPAARDELLRVFRGWKAASPPPAP
jgi:anti-sigma factor RsiW